MPKKLQIAPPSELILATLKGLSIKLLSIERIQRLRANVEIRRTRVSSAGFRTDRVGQLTDCVKGVISREFLEIALWIGSRSHEEDAGVERGAQRRQMEKGGDDDKTFHVAGCKKNGIHSWKIQVAGR